MKSIQKILTVNKSSKVAFDLFVDHFGRWWPKKYTWSQENLKDIKIEPKIDGLCTEIGPYNFRCDWGRVTALEMNKKIIIKWQIGPTRIPQPNPSHASKIEINFMVKERYKTKIILEHLNFENHGEGAEEYRTAMDSAQGWDYILNEYWEYCNRNN